MAFHKTSINEMQRIAKKILLHSWSNFTFFRFNIFKLCNVVQKLKVVPFEKLKKKKNLKGVPQKCCIFDPMCEKPKCFQDKVDVFNLRKFSYFFQLFVYNFSKQLPPFKHTLALPTQNQKCTFSELQLFTSKWYKKMKKNFICWVLMVDHLQM